MAHPGDSQQPPPESAEQRQRRAQALHDLAQRQQEETGGAGQPAPHVDALQAHYSLAPRQRTKRISWRLVGAGVILLGIVAGVALRLTLLAPHGLSQPRAHRLAIVPIENRLECPRDVAWSPDGTRIAVLGYELNCPSLQGPMGGTVDPHVAGLVNIYDTGTGRLVAQIHPDKAIMDAVPVPSAVIAFGQQALPTQTISYYDVNYTHLFWSRDNHALTLTFDLYLPTSPPVTNPDQSSFWPGVVVTGVELMDTGGTSPRVLTHRADQRIVPYTEWDLSTGTLVSPPTTSPEPSSYTGLQPALAYRWGSDGALIPESPVSSDGIPTAPPLGPIGDPNGGPTFTIWQPGIASLEIPGAPGQFPLQNTYNWATDIATWSPDERYLIEGIDITGLLASSQSPIPTRTTLAAHKWAQAPVFPVRDAGLQQAATIAASDSFTSGFLYPAAPVGPDGASWLGAAQRTGVLAVWRPDGRAVAIDADTADHAVTILDCASGRKLAILTPLTQSVAPNPTHEDGEMNVLRWSADGAQLALFDTTLGTVTIWGSSQLPHP